jgi:membrane-associated protease RseP (regulator of RpoE activity)
MAISLSNLPFWVYDVIFLIIFGLVVGIFLYRKRKNLKREMGVGLLYKAQWGVKFINYIGKKYARTLSVLKYVVIVLGYILMAEMVYMIVRAAYMYARFPVQLAKAVPAPPLAPVIPYFPTLFGVEAFFPPFYFTYFILALGIVAIVHEFSHGIFMRKIGVRIKSTGIFFLGPFFGAFVEQNEKDMQKAKKTDQMAILGAGVFANIVVGIVFVFVWIGLFYAAFTPAGTSFEDYSQNIVNITSITMIGNLSINNLNNKQMISLLENRNLSQDLILKTNGDFLAFTKIKANNKTYYMTKKGLIDSLNYNLPMVPLYEDFPAINAGLRGSIIEIEGYETKTFKDFLKVMENFKPGDEISLKTKFGGEILEFDITLGENPHKPGKPLIGVAEKGFRTNIAEWMAFKIFKERNTNYEVKNRFLEYLYFLVFWIVLINFLVGLFNMLPFAVLDGGRFFFLTIWGLTRSEKIGKAAYKWAGIIILAMFILMMLGWVFGISS